jgi:hypothetical protein
MKPKTLRTYVWLFSLYIFTTVQMFHHSQLENTRYPDHSVLNIANLILGSALAIIVFVSLFAELRNVIDKWVVLLSALGCALTLAFNLYRLNYISFYVPYLLSSFTSLIATILFGFRIDQLLKKHNAVIDLATSELQSAEDS